MKRRYEPFDLESFSRSLSKTLDELELQRKLADKYKLKSVMWESMFFGKNDLADKLRKQLEENEKALIGEFD